MSELIHKLGIDSRLLLSQAVNFALLVVILRYFLYKPILNILKERKKRIQEGIEKAERAEERLKESGRLAAERLKAAEREALEIRREAEARAKSEEAKILEEAHRKEAAILMKAESVIEAKSKEAFQAVEREAGQLLKSLLIKVIELDPKAVDEKLIDEAVKKL